MITDNGVDIHLSEAMVEAIRKHGHGASAGEVKRTVCRWCAMLDAGECELRRTFTDGEIRDIVDAVAAQARADGLNSRELWEMGAGRLAEIVGMRQENLRGRCLGLSELAAMWIKEEAGGAVAMRAGYGGRPRRG